MKTFIKSIFILCLIVLSVWNSSFSVCALNDTELKLHARSAILIDASNGRVLYEENGYEIMPMASTTKIMTCILAIESGKLNEYVTVSSYAQMQPKVKLGLKEGDAYRLEDLLYSLMLESHNDTAVAIAEFLGGSVEGFAKIMNAKAKELGCTDTFFITPNGLDATCNGKKHSSTAYDMALITAYALKNEIFCELIKTASHTFTDEAGEKQYTVYNKDSFLKQYEGAIGVKTGFTNGAGYCFVGAVKRGEATFISVVLGCGWPPHKTWKWVDTGLLMNYGTQKYEYHTFVGEKKYCPIKVTDGIADEVKVEVKREEIGLLLCEDEKITTGYELVSSLEAPVQKGQIVGYETYMLHEEELARFPIVATQNIEKITFWYCFEQVIQKILL